MQIKFETNRWLIWIQNTIKDEFLKLDIGTFCRNSIKREIHFWYVVNLWFALFFVATKTRIYDVKNGQTFHLEVSKKHFFIINIGKK